MIEIDQLIQPISIENACGVDLRYEPVYAQIRKARFSEDSTLPQGVWVRPTQDAQWDLVDKLCIDTLLHKSKDLQIACWLLDAWYHRHWLDGLLHGLDLIDQLVTRFWNDLYPQHADGARESPFVWINEKFSNKLFLLPLSSEKDSAAITFAEYKKMTMMTAKDRQVMAKDCEYQLKSQPADFFYDMASKCAQIIDLSKGIEAFVEQQPGGADISLFRFRQLIEEIQSMAQSFSPKEVPLPIQKAIDAPSEAENSVVEIVPGSLVNRVDAYQNIAKIADLLQELEPHSPTPYLLRKAIHWGNMTLQELLQEFIKSGMSLQQMQTWIGMPAVAIDPIAKNANS